MIEDDLEGTELPANVEVCFERDKSRSCGIPLPVEEFKTNCTDDTGKD